MDKIITGFGEALTREEIMKKGKLISVKTPRGHYVKMYEADAIAQGYINPVPVKAKSRPAQESKMIPPAKNKAVAPKPVEAKEVIDTVKEADDFTTINGIGLGSARALRARGILTFEQLRGLENLKFLGKSAQGAIEKWRSNG